VCRGGTTVGEIFFEFLYLNKDRRSAHSDPVGAFALVVVFQALLHVLGDTDAEGAVGALENVTVKHCEIWCPSTSLGTPYPSPDVVEAGGVEPPSEKPCCSKTTCLSRSDCFAVSAQNGQDAPAASPMISPARYGPKRASQPAV
jgi:hypothetical protein